MELLTCNFKSEEKQAPPEAPPSQVPETPGGAALVHEFIKVEGAQLYDSDTGGEAMSPHSPQLCAADADRSFNRHAGEDGYLDRKRLFRALSEARPSTTRDQVAAILLEFDANGDGVLDRDEFTALMGSFDSMRERVAADVVGELSSQLLAWCEVSSGWRALAKYVLFVLATLTVYIWQHSHAAVAKSMADTIYNTLASPYTESGRDVPASFLTKSRIFDWWEALAVQGWAKPTCGDGFCEAPDEFPTFIATWGAHLPGAREFSPCFADCGSYGPGEVVTVEFDDLMKLMHSYGQYDRLLEHGYGYSASFYGFESDEAEPAVGWNVCSRDVFEYGHFEPLCLFDGDIFIDGLPYRTAELNRSDALFGGKIDLTLFNGAWEVRIAADDRWRWYMQSDMATWTQVAYPAIGGTVTVAGVTERWAPCPHADTCANMFYRGEYLQDCAPPGGGPVVWDDPSQVLSCEWSMYLPQTQFLDTMQQNTTAHGPALAALYADNGTARDAIEMVFAYALAWNASDDAAALASSVSAADISALVASFGGSFDFGTSVFSGTPIGSVGDGMCSSDYPFAMSVFANFDGTDCCCSTCQSDSGLCDVYGGCGPWGDCKGPIALTNETTGWDFCSKYGSSVLKYPLPINQWPTCTEQEMADRNALHSFPFMAWHGLRDQIEQFTGAGTFKMKQMPSTLCPDCAAYEGPYMSVPFDITTAVEPAAPGLFPPLVAPRQRFIGKNMVVLGALFTQKRATPAKCDQFADYFLPEFAARERTCPAAAGDNSGSENRAPFGVDTTLAYGSSTLYRQSNWATMPDAEGNFPTDGAPGAFQVYPDLFEYCVSVGFDGSCYTAPPGFYYDQGSGRSASKINYPYAVLFDVNFNDTRVLEIITLLRDGEYLDEQTAQMSIILPMYNAEAGLWALSTLAFAKLPGGAWDYSLTTSVVDLDVYYTKWDRARFAFELVFACVLVFSVGQELAQMRTAKREAGKLRAYFQSLENWLDLFVYACMLASVALWAQVYAPKSGLAAAIDPAIAIDLWQDPLAVTGLLRMKAAEQATMEAFFDDLGRVVRRLSAVQTAQSVGILGMVLQLVLKLQFHPRLGMISRTIEAIAFDLAFFFMLFFWIVLLFTVIGFGLFGSALDGFVDFQSSAVSCLFMLGLGNAPDYGEMVNAAGFIAQVWYWLYIMIGFFVLMSALLAIVVAGYDAASARVDKHWRDPLANSIRLMWRHAVASVSPAKAAGALPIMTDVEVLSALSGLTLAQHTQEAPGSPRRKLRQQASVNHLEKKLSSQGGTLVSDEVESPTSDRVVVIFGTKMTDVQLAHLFERVLVLERGSLSAMTLAVNVMMRLGVRSDAVSDEELEDAHSGSNKKKAAEVAAFRVLAF